MLACLSLPMSNSLSPTMSIYVSVCLTMSNSVLLCCRAPFAYPRVPTNLSVGTLFLKRRVCSRLFVVAFPLVFLSCSFLPPSCSNLQSGVSMCICVCVLEREGERERQRERERGSKRCLKQEVFEARISLRLISPRRISPRLICSHVHVCLCVYVYVCIYSQEQSR